MSEKSNPSEEHPWIANNKIETKKAKNFIVENQSQILAGVLLVVMIKNRRLRRQNFKLVQKVATLEKTFTETLPRLEELVKNRNSLMDMYFGGRR